MSRTGKKPVILSEKVKARLDKGTLFVEGPLGKNQFLIPEGVVLKIEGNQILVTRAHEERLARERHGMVRAVVQNMVTGVANGFSKVLEIEGIGYRADVKGSVLGMTLGFSHPVEFPLPAGIKVAVEKQTKITISGSDRNLVGQVAANIRQLRPPEPYKGKGIRYLGEVIERKAGKAAATAGGGK